MRTEDALSPVLGKRMPAKGRKTWVLPGCSWQLGIHVTHGIYTEQAAHVPLTCLGSKATTEYQCPREFQIKQRKINQGEETHTHAHTHTEQKVAWFHTAPQDPRRSGAGAVTLHRGEGRTPPRHAGQSGHPHSHPRAPRRGPELAHVPLSPDPDLMGPSEQVFPLDGASVSPTTKSGYQNPHLEVCCEDP